METLSYYAVKNSILMRAKPFKQSEALYEDALEITFPKKKDHIKERCVTLRHEYSSHEVTQISPFKGRLRALSLSR